MASNVGPNGVSTMVYGGFVGGGRSHRRRSTVDRESYQIVRREVLLAGQADFVQVLKKKE